MSNKRKESDMVDKTSSNHCFKMCMKMTEKMTGKYNQGPTSCMTPNKEKSSYLSTLKFGNKLYLKPLDFSFLIIMFGLPVSDSFLPFFISYLWWNENEVAAVWLRLKYANGSESNRT